MMSGSNIKIEIYNGTPSFGGIQVYETSHIEVLTILTNRLNFGFEPAEVTIINPDVGIFEGYQTKIIYSYGSENYVVHFGIIKSININYDDVDNIRRVTLQITTAGALMELQDIHQLTEQEQFGITCFVLEAFNHQQIMKLHGSTLGLLDTALVPSVNTNSLATSMTNFARTNNVGWTVDENAMLKFVELEPIVNPPLRVINNQNIASIQYGSQSDRQNNIGVKQGFRAGIPGNIIADNSASVPPSITQAIYSWTHNTPIRHTLNGVVFMTPELPDQMFTLELYENGNLLWTLDIDLNYNGDTEQLWIDDDADLIADRHFRKVIFNTVLELRNGVTYEFKGTNSTGIPQDIPLGVYYLITNMGFGSKILNNENIDQQDINNENLQQDFVKVTLKTNSERYELGNRVLLTGLNIPEIWQTNLICTKIEFDGNGLTTYTFGSDEETLRDLIKKIARTANN